MKTLLIDNYDSFTFNLYHDLAEVNGVAPTVIRNDDSRFSLSDLACFDNIVLSPGPGTPQREEDFGLCLSIIRHAEIPLLGICLGHQGLCYAEGAPIVRAPKPCHGQTSPVLHGGVGLFAQIPSPFEVVRYHSLVANDLPPQLTVIAQTADGMIMGVQHVRRPQWGLQFHPESVCTAHGLQLLLNFRRETEARSRSHDRKPKPHLHWQAEDIHRPPGASKHAFEPAAHSLRDFDQKPRIVWKAAQIEAPSDAVFEHLFADSPHAYWLDSSLKRETLGGWSFMGDARGPLARIARYDVSTRCIEVSTASRTSVVHVPYLDWLDRDLAEQRTELPPDAPFEFSLGWIGYLGYELKADGFGNAAHRAPYPDACMIFADRAIAFDHSTGFVYVIALEASEAKVPWIEPTLERLKKRPASMRHRQRPALRSRLELRHSKPDYIRMIDQCQRMIRAGETYEVCLTNMLSGTIDGSPLETYLYLRDANPAPFGAFLRFGDLAILSMSPERFLSVNNSGIVESRPIKGTRPRGQSPSEDAAIIAELQRSPKDRAENLMIVDLVRNDLGRCAEIGTVSVDQIFSVETYATVHQLVSVVRARLRSACSGIDVVRAAFPGGSMTGAPKKRTMQIIDELEQGPRGIYSGAIGYFGLAGNIDLSIVIRTLVIERGRFEYGVGGAIIALSDPDTEYEETAVKAEALLRLLGAPFPDRQRYKEDTPCSTVAATHGTIESLLQHNDP